MPPVPCAAFATVHRHHVSIEALLAAVDGSVVVRAQAESSDPVEAGIAVLKAIFDHGGRELLGSYHLPCRGLCCIAQRRGQR